MSPGPDAVESPDGAVYVRDHAGWRTLPLPGVVHANDVIVHGDRLCVAVQDDFNGGAVRCSRDDGATWTTYRTGGFRAVTLFELGDALYVSSHDVGIQRIGSELTPVTLELEGVRPDADVLVSRPVHCGESWSSSRSRSRTLVTAPPSRSSSGSAGNAWCGSPATR